jgi:hypothetical protein
MPRIFLELKRHGYKFKLGSKETVDANKRHIHVWKKVIHRKHLTQQMYMKIADSIRLSLYMRDNITNATYFTPSTG